MRPSPEPTYRQMTASKYIGLCLRNTLLFAPRVLWTIVVGDPDPKVEPAKAELDDMKQRLANQEWYVEEMRSSNKQLQRSNGATADEIGWIRDFRQTTRRTPSINEVLEQFPYLARTTAWRRIQESSRAA